MPGALESLAQEAGLIPGYAETVAVTLMFPDDASALRGLLASGPAIRAVRSSGEATASAAVLEAIAPYRRPDGSFALRNEFRFLLSHAPAAPQA